VTASDILMAPMDGSGRVTPVVETKARETAARLSPDGKWLAYVSDESGRNEVYAQRFNDASTRRQVSQSGGGTPRWRGDGREIFFLGATRDHLWAVDVDLPATGAAAPGIPHLLFAVSRRLVDYDVTRDGQRVLLAPDVPREAGALSVFLHAPALLKSLPFVDVEGDALSHVKLLGSLAAKGLEPPGIRSHIQGLTHRHLQAASSVHGQSHASLGADGRPIGGKDRRAVLLQAESRRDIWCCLPHARKGKQETGARAQRVNATLATTIRNVRLETERGGQREGDRGTHGGCSGRTNRDVRRHFDGLCFLCANGQGSEREHDDGEGSRSDGHGV
jgi:WD40-like Beta Propeller Repeat